MNVIKSTFPLFAALCITLPVMAVEPHADRTVSRTDFTMQGDLVSSYVWRGMYQSGAAFQPTFGLNVAGFSLTAFGSVDFTGQGHKEADLTAAYSIAGFSVSLSDYWWAGESGIRNNHENGYNRYFNFNSHTTDHILEVGLSYELPFASFPLKISWSTMVWGADRNVSSAGTVSQAYSSYAELSFPFAFREFGFLAAVGCSPWESQRNYFNRQFAVTNVSLRATRTIRITERFDLPLFVSLLWNPDRQDVHFVFGITFRPGYQK